MNTKSSNSNKKNGKLKHHKSLPKHRNPPTILKFSRNQFKSRKSVGHAIRDIISEITDYLSPILKLFFPNFIAVHYVYITFMTLLCSLMMLPITKASDGKYIDTLLLAASSTSQGGLNTVNINTLTTWQQVCIYLFCFLTTPIFIHSVLAFVRLYWFERYFDGIRDWSKRNFKTRRTRTLIHQNMTGGSFGKPNLTSLWSTTTGGNRSDRVLSQYVSPVARTRSRGSTRSNTRKRTITSTGNVDFAKPPQKTEIKFGGADIDIKNRQNSKKNGLKKVKSGMGMSQTKTNNSAISTEDSKKKLATTDKEDEDFQSRLFRGEVVCRDEDDNDEVDDKTDNSDKTSSDEKNISLEDGYNRPSNNRNQTSVPIDDDDGTSYFTKQHKSLKTSPNSQLALDKNKEESDFSKKPSVTTNSSVTKNTNEQPHLHFNIPEKPKLGKPKHQRSLSSGSGVWKKHFFSKVATNDMKNKDVIELSDRNKSDPTDSFQKSTEPNDQRGVLIPEDISPEKLETLIHDPEFQKEIYKNWKHHQREGAQQRRMSSIQFPRLNTASNRQNNLKRNYTVETKKVFPTLKHRTLSSNLYKHPFINKTSSRGNNEDDFIPKAHEEWHDDGMDWENGKMLDNSQKSHANNNDALASSEDLEDEDETEPFDGSPSTQTSDGEGDDDYDYADEEDDDYDDDYDYEEDENADDDDVDDEEEDDEDYGDDYDDGDIDFDYDYADDASDEPNFQIVPTNNFIIGRNSKFVGLTDDQKEELGGVEYRALKLLCKYLVGYYFGFNLFSAVLFLGWICSNKSKPLDEYSGNDAAIKIGQIALKDAGVGRVWWGFFTSASSFNDLGLTLTANSMINFGGASYILIWSMFFIIIGNTGFPVFLRFILWIAHKMSSPLSQRSESLQFLLEHPRRCFTLLFPRGPTWWLFMILILLNGFDWIMFIILDFGSSYLKDTLGNGWFRVLNGLYQSVCTRTAGFATTNISELSPAVQVSYMLMMYVSVMPLAISIRRTNVYEEQSLGIYHDTSNEKANNSGRTYTQQSSMSRKDPAKAPLVNGDKDPINDNELEDHASSFIGMHLRRQLSFDLWFLFLGLFIICICESKRIKDLNDPNFTIWTILFEIVSAYGTVGLSLGYPNTDTSFCAQFTILSKFIVVLLLLRGKHRGLPNSLDRAIMLPSDHLQQIDNKQFKLLGDDQNERDVDEEEEGNEVHSYNVEDEESGEHEIDNEMDLGADNRLQRFNSLTSTTRNKERLVAKDPLLHYFKKRKNQAKNFVSETSHAILHPSNEYHHHQQNKESDA